jgi:hypothetical protein
LNHSRVSTTSKHYIKAEDRGLLQNEEEELFNKTIDDILFGDTETDVGNPLFDKKIIKKREINIKNTNLLNNKSSKLDLDDPELDNDDNSLFDSIFENEPILNVDQEHPLNSNFIINKKGKENLLVMIMKNILKFNYQVII